jgi:hypothetical protein
MTTYEISEALDAWLHGSDRGISSNTIVEHLTGFPALGGGAPSYPHDADDLGRCVRLLIACPELRARVLEMRTCSPVWAAMVDRWDELIAVYLEEVKDPSEGTCRTDVLLREIIDPLYEAEQARDQARMEKQLKETGVVRMRLPMNGLTSEDLEKLEKIVGPDARMLNVDQG